MGYNYDDNYWDSRIEGSKNRNVPRGVHIMGKPEAKVCRKLMADTGLTEEELREHKKYRKLLSEAQKEGEKAKLNARQKKKRDLMKKATKTTGLAKEHPDTKKVYAELVDEWW